MPPIRFYLPDALPADLPASPDVYWPGFADRMRTGIYAWIVQTCERLRASGFPCEYTRHPPADGLFIAHRKSLPREYVPPRGVLFVCVRADATFHPHAHLHVVQNRQAMSAWYPARYMPHWPQPGLLPRDPARGDQWRNAAFFGDPGCLADEMRGAAWQATLRELELQWHFVGVEKWHDYREVDVVVAVRGFDRHRHANKPPTKLFNAWRAGVPAVLGCESAYQHERRGPLDYLEVDSFAEVVEALRRLKAEPSLRRAMAANGLQRGRESDPAVITARWRDFFESMAIPAYEKWRHAPGWKRALFRWNGRLKTVAQNGRKRLGR